jgi:hypothetical protein
MRILAPLLALTGFGTIGGLQAQETSFDPGQNANSSQNCTFQADPSAFLLRETRARKAVFDRAAAFDVKLSGSIRTLSSATSPDDQFLFDSIPHVNFIDDEIFGKMASANVPPPLLSTDEEFFRRITLDLTGRIPSSADVRAFLADTNPTKRSAVIDKLLFSPEFADKWTMWLGDLLENNASSVNFTRNVTGRNAFYKFIWDSVSDQVSIKDAVFQILTATGNHFDEPNPAGYILNGNAPGGPADDTYDMLLYKSAKAFLGLGHYDCLLCHSGRGHLDQISLWGANTSRTQAENMAAFFSRTSFRSYSFPPGTSLPDQQASFYYQSYIVSDAATGTYAIPTTYGNRPNRLAPGGQKSIDPIYRLGQTPSNGNWRAEFAKNLVNDPLFAVNFANRLWKQMFNLGLVDAVDSLDPSRLDPSNPPPAPWDFQATHPVLLQRLADRFTAGGFNLREFLRLIAESSAYQLSSRYPGEWKASSVPLFVRHYPRRLDAEEVHDAIAKSTGVFTKYSVQGWGNPVVWAMQLPDTLEPRSNGTTGAFMNYFLRGNRDNVPRSQAVTVLQPAALMNDNFVMTKIHMAQSPTLQGVAKLTTPKDQLEEVFLTFLGRMPTNDERSTGMALLGSATTAAQKNAALEDLAWALTNKLDFLFSY